jgi:hypothetical protein
MNRPHRGKIFGIGLSRTGSQSLAMALQALGYRVKHWPMHVSDCHLHDATLDLGTAMRLETLDRFYPGAKFIYTTRDLEAWLDSCRRHWQAKPPRSFPPPSDIEATEMEQELAVYGSLAFDRDRWAGAWHAHRGRVRDHFAERPGDLLIMDIPGGDGWETLLPFLGFETIPFPYLNQGLTDDDFKHQAFAGAEQYVPPSPADPSVDGLGELQRDPPADAPLDPPPGE